MATRCPRVENEYLTAEFWPEGLNAQPVAARVISLAPGVLCMATEAPPAPGARFITKFSVRGEFPIVAGCQARWRLERGAGESWVSATFLTLATRDWEMLFTAWRQHLATAGPLETSSELMATAGRL
jgi:hypothetical protein